MNPLILIATLLFGSTSIAAKNCYTFGNDVERLVNSVNGVHKSINKKIAKCFIEGEDHLGVSTVARELKKSIKMKARTSLHGYGECIKGMKNPAAVNWYVENLYNRLGEDFAGLVLYCSPRGRELLPSNPKAKIDFAKLQKIVEGFLQLKK